MTKEEWKTIPGFSRYKASSLGRIKSFCYTVPRILKPNINSRGYFKVNVANDDRTVKNKDVHCLVALAFLGLRKDGMHVNHKNGIKMDNRISNLEYITISENCIHAYKLGLRRPPRTVLRDEDIAYIKQMRDQGKSRGWIARKLKVSNGCVNHVVQGRTWTHLNLFPKHESRKPKTK